MKPSNPKQAWTFKEAKANLAQVLRLAETDGPQYIRAEAASRKAGTMDENLQKSRFSLAYIEAVASRAGQVVAETKVDIDSVDGVFASDSGRRPRVEFQAKATSRDVVRGDNIHFPLSIKNYDDLRLDAINPRILIVLLMPDSIDEWLSQTDDELCLRHCAYWMSLKGEPESGNTSNITVRVPLTNMFNSEQLIDMMQKTNLRGAI